MRMLILCLSALVISITGLMLCEGVLKDIFQYGFFGALGVSGVLLLLGHFN